MADIGVFSRYKGFNDFQEEARKNSLAEALAMAQMQKAQSGGDLPAPLKLANEYQKRLQAGDIEGANQILMFAKAADRGLVTDATGTFQSAPGYAPAVAGIEGAKAGTKEQASKNVQLVMNPQIKQKESYSGEVGKQQGETASDLNAAAAAMPQLEASVETLKDLGKKATYTYTGQGINAAVRQAGLGATEGATARAAYIAHVKNNVLPLLRRTFGAQFTKAEGDSLLATLGDPNMSSPEKDAVLDAFIADKRATLGTMQRQTGGLNSPQGGEVSLYKQGEADFNARKSSALNPREKAESVFNAKKALKTGKPPEAIKQRLIDAGIDPAEAGL